MRHSPVRKAVNKAKAARGFRHDVSRTNIKNVQMAPRRGGWRL